MDEQKTGDESWPIEKRLEATEQAVAHHITADGTSSGMVTAGQKLIEASMKLRAKILFANAKRK